MMKACYNLHSGLRANCGESTCSCSCSCSDCSTHGCNPSARPLAEWSLWRWINIWIIFVCGLDIICTLDCCVRRVERWWRNIWTRTIIITACEGVERRLSWRRGGNNKNCVEWGNYCSFVDQAKDIKVKFPQRHCGDFDKWDMSARWDCHNLILVSFGIA